MRRQGVVCDKFLYCNRMFGACALPLEQNVRDVHTSPRMERLGHVPVYFS